MSNGRQKSGKAGKTGKKISLFGHFGQNNFGNDSTLQTILYHLRRFLPDAEVTCICTAPEITAKTYSIAAVPIHGVVIEPWNLRSPVAKLLRKICVGIPSEIYRWLEALTTLSDCDMLIIPGTGLLTDAYGVLRWGPYNLFKWTLSAKHARTVFQSRLSVPTKRRLMQSTILSFSTNSPLGFDTAASVTDSRTNPAVHPEDSGPCVRRAGVRQPQRWG